jgi:hypothetical protein
MRPFSSLIYPAVFALLLPKVIASSPPLHETQTSHLQEQIDPVTSAENDHRAGRYLHAAIVLERLARIHKLNARFHATEGNFPASYRESQKAEGMKEKAKRFRSKSLNLLTRHRQVARSA